MSVVFEQLHRYTVAFSACMYNPIRPKHTIVRVRILFFVWQ